MSTTGSALPNAAAAFRHEAVLYRGPDEFVAVLHPLLRNGIATGASILVAVDAATADLIRGELGPDADAIVDVRSVGRNPARIIPVWCGFVRERGERGALGVGEPVWPGRSPQELQECELHESLLNVAFSGGPPWRLLCPYDVVNLSPGEVNTALQTHPIVPGLPEEPACRADRVPIWRDGPTLICEVRDGVVVRLHTDLVDTRVA